MSHNLELGRRGEDAAEQWYRQAGYRILARNWRCGIGELDLVVASGSLVAFVEVKTRSSPRFGTGAEAVDHRKQQKVRSVAGRWLADANRRYQDVRFDVVDVDGRGRLEIYEGCF